MAEDNKFESNILPLLGAGAIKYPEQNVAIHVNCVSGMDVEGSTASAGRGLKV